MSQLFSIAQALSKRNESSAKPGKDLWGSCMLEEVLDEAGCHQQVDIFGFE